MINRLVKLALSQRVIVLALALLLLITGLYAFSQLDVEAYPDPVQPMIELLTLPTLIRD